MEEILKLIKERKSDRLLFDEKRAISKHDLEKILEAARWTPTAHNMQNFEIVLVDNKKQLEAIGKLEFPISPEFVRENYQQLSFSEEELKKKKVGILGTNFPPEMRVPVLKPDVKLSNTFLGKTISTSPVILIVLYDPSKRAPASEGDFLGIVSLGCAMENIWLMANSLGIAVHIVSSISSESVEKEVKKIFSIPENLKIAFSIRLGYAQPSAEKQLHIRRDIKDFTHHNQYGNKGTE